MSPPWTEQELTYLKSNYGLLTCERLAAKISKIDGNKRSKYSIAIKAQRLGLEHDKADGCLTVQEAAKLGGFSVNVIYHEIKKGRVKPLQSSGKCIFISLADFDSLCQKYKPIPKTYTLTKTQTIKLLGYSETHVTRLLLAGFIRGVRHGDRWYIDETHIRQLIKEMKEKCLVRMDLSGVQTEYMQDQRAKCRQYQQKRKAAK
jgi:hypothetical protein